MTSQHELLEPFVHLINQVISIEVDPATIGEHTDIAADLMFDSISLVSLVALSEEWFGVDLSANADEIAGIKTVGDALALIASAQRSAVDALAVGA